MIDLHTHTTYSDGTSNLEELLKEAESKNLSILSITDHNSVEVYFELDKFKGLFSGKIIPGIEITTTYKGEVVEVLGYNFDLEIMKKLLSENVLSFKDKQQKERELIKNKFIKLNLKMDLDYIMLNPNKVPLRESFRLEIIKYKENEKYFLFKESLTSKSSFARNEIFNPKSSLYVDQSSLYPSLEQSIKMIHESGGLAFLAHTFAYSSNISDQLLDILDKYNLDGLECYHTIFTDEQKKYLIDLCNKRKLFKSGGSDYHGRNKINHDLGNQNIADKLIIDWYKV